MTNLRNSAAKFILNQRISWFYKYTYIYFFCCCCSFAKVVAAEKKSFFSPFGIITIILIMQTKAVSCRLLGASDSTWTWKHWSRNLKPFVFQFKQIFIILRATAPPADRLFHFCSSVCDDDDVIILLLFGVSRTAVSHHRLISSTSFTAGVDETDRLQTAEN